MSLLGALPFKPSLLCLTIASVTCVMAAPAVQANGNEVELDTLVVKGSQAKNQTTYKTQESSAPLKMPLTLKETPQTVNVITSQQIEDQQLTTVGKVLDQTPGINRVEYGVSGACISCNDFLARGFIVQNFQLDGVPVASSLIGAMAEQNSAAYERIEVVKGANGLLSGSGYPSASVNLVRKRPTIEPQVHLSASVGSWDTHRSQVDVAGALNNEGSLRGRAVVNYQDNKNWMDRVNQHRSSAYTIVEYDLTDATMIDAGISYSKIHTTGGGVHSFRKYDTKTGEKTHFSRSDNASADWAYSDIETTTLFADVKHNFNENWQLTASLLNSYLKTDRIYGVLGTRKLEGTAATLTYGKEHKTPTQLAFDLALTGSYNALGREHDLMIGANAFRSTRNDRLYAGGNLNNISVIGWDGNIDKPDMSYSGGRDKETIRQQGLYAATRFKATDDLALIVGARVSDWHKRAERSDSSSPTSNYDRKETGVVTPYAGIVYDLTSQWAAYASYTSIFNPQNYQTESGSYLDPEEGNSYELGLKGSLLDDRLALNLAVFQTDLDNLAVRDGDKETPDGYAAYKAENGTRSKGYELSLSGEVLPDWHINAGYSHSVTKGKDGSRIKTDMTPMDQIKLFTSYRLPNELNKLTVGGGITWQSTLHNSSSNKLQLKSGQQRAYSVVSLMARYQVTPQLDVGLNANNIFDKHYTLNVSNHTYGEPRSLTASINWNY